MGSLVEKVLDGDEQAVTKLYQLYSPPLLRYLQQKLPLQEAQETLNDIFLEAIDSLPTLRKQESFPAWLYRIAHNKMVDYYRKQRVKAFLFSQIPYLQLVAKEITEPEFYLEKQRLKERIEHVLHTLSEKYERILRMHYEEQMPVKQMAFELQLSFKATESLLYRARQQFIKTYERE